MKFQKMYPDAQTPEYATKGSAAFDLRAHLKDDVYVHPGETKLIGTGLKFQPSGWQAIVLLPRSGLGHKNGIVLGNLVGLCDSDYTGEYMISCWNRSVDGEAFKISNGDRIAQAMVIPVIRETFEEVEELSTTDRGEGGFGSTGK